MDTSFGGDGKVVTNRTHGYWDDWASALAIQADGRIVFAGGANLGRSKMNVALARYLAAAVGTPPTASAVASSPSPGHTATASSLGDGVYLVGTDIPAGRYRAEATLEEGNWKISRDANGTLVVHSADGLSVSTRGKRRPPFYIHVKQGQYLTLHSVKVRRVK